MTQNPNPAKRILLRGDDVGMNSAVNDAFIRAVQAGLLKNVGLLVPAPGAREAVERLMPFKETLSLGLHAALTSEWDRLKWGPVSDLHKVPTLHDQNGHFFPDVQEFKHHYLVHGVDIELRAQFDLALSWGYEPDYMDHHMAYHWIEELQPTLSRIAADYGVYHELNQPLERLPKEMCRAMITERDFHGLHELPPGDYLWILHPGGLPEEMGGLRIDPEKQREIVEHRAAETEFLCDPVTREAFEEAGIDLLTYRRLQEETQR
jgi:hypothetical protein